MFNLLVLPGAILAGCVPGASGNTQPTSVSTQAAGDDCWNAPSCVVRPGVTEGPYYVDEELNRSDVRSDPSSGVVKEGALLALTFNVSQISEAGCAPLEGAKVEIWHCDADGVYSDVSDPGFNTQGQKFLRGFQVTDANGRAALPRFIPAGTPAAPSTFTRCTTIPREEHRIYLALFFDDAPPTRFSARRPMPAKGSATRSTARIEFTMTSCCSL
jgi:protocatechuate 3,4-dioxygenase beta subunit